jgi:hypothetical protein
MEILLYFIPDLWEFLTLLALMFISIVVAYLLQWNPKLSILQIDAFNIEPFNCVYCFQFWCNLIPNVILAYIWNPMFLLWGLITAGALTYSVYRSIKK